MSHKLNLNRLKEKYFENTGSTITNVEIVDLLKKEGVNIYTQEFTIWQKKLPKCVTVLKKIEEVTGVSQKEFIDNQ
jgi:hypothetical protein